MCGICGMVDLGAGPDAELVSRMADALVHRGPDDRGEFRDEHAALAFLRLSIIDLSPLGHQPMATRDGRVQMVFNGEIYNYRELRSELQARGHTFASESDSEVLLAAYVEWDVDCLAHLRGMWAFAIWDAEARRLFCAVDRFGIKPFYYRSAGPRLVFASEPKAFRGRRGAGSCRTSAPRATTWPTASATTAARPSSTTSSGSPARTRSSSTSGACGCHATGRSPRPASGPAIPTRRCERLFFESIRLHLRSDVAVGTCLSGGIDSSAVAGTVAHLLRTSSRRERGRPAPADVHGFLRAGGLRRAALRRGRRREHRLGGRTGSPSTPRGSSTTCRPSSTPRTSRSARPASSRSGT